MKKEKLSLNSIKTTLSRAELKKIMAGGGSSGNCSYCGPGGYNYCGCYNSKNQLVLTGTACGNGSCAAYCNAALGPTYYGSQLPCPH